MTYIPNTSRVFPKLLTSKRQNGGKSSFIEEVEEKEHEEYMKVKVELGEVASVKLEQSDLAWIQITTASPELGGHVKLQIFVSIQPSLAPEVLPPVNHRPNTDNKLT